MFSRQSYILFIAGAGVIALAIAADRFGVLNGAPHPVSLLRIIGFASIAIGLWIILIRN
jgi:uncharacterized membrane protein YdcZ (DUF606 family)